MSSGFALGQLLLVLLLGVLWGVNWPAVKYLLTELPPLTIRALAFPLAAIILALVARVNGQRLMPAARDWPWLMFTGLFVIFGFNVLATLGQLVTEASKAAIIAYTMPALTGVLAAVFLHERLTIRRLVALSLAMIGISVLALENFSELIAAPAGVIIMLLAALCWSIGNVMLKARHWSIQPLPLTVWFFVFSALAVWPLVLYFEPLQGQIWPSTSVVFTLLYHILGPMVICYTIWTSLVDKLPATVAAISALTAPLVGVASSVILIPEAFSLNKAIALLLIVLSVALTLNLGRKKPVGVQLSGD